MEIKKEERSWAFWLILIGASFAWLGVIGLLGFIAAGTILSTTTAMIFWSAFLGAIVLTAIFHRAYVRGIDQQIANTEKSLRAIRGISDR